MPRLLARGEIRPSSRPMPAHTAEWRYLLWEGNSARQVLSIMPCEVGNVSSRGRRRGIPHYARRLLPGRRRGHLFHMRRQYVGGI